MPRVDLEGLAGKLSKEQAMALLKGNTLPGKLVIRREAGRVGRLGDGAVPCHLLLNDRVG